MNKKLGAKVDMWRTLVGLKSHAPYATVIATVPGVAAGFTTLEGMITQMEALDVSRQGAASKAGPAKDVARDLLEGTVAVVDGIFTAYAAQTNDELLLAQVNKERSHLHNMRDEALRVHGEFLLGQIPGTIPAALSGLGLTPALQTLLQDRYDAFYALMTLPQSKSGQESTYVGLMETLEDQGDKLLDLTLDKLMRQFEETEVEFYTAYREARVINDAGTQPEEDEGGEEPPPGS